MMDDDDLFSLDFTNLTPEPPKPVPAPAPVAAPAPVVPPPAPVAAAPAAPVAKAAAPAPAAPVTPAAKAPAPTSPAAKKAKPASAPLSLMPVDEPLALEPLDLQTPAATSPLAPVPPSSFGSGVSLEMEPVEIDNLPPVKPPGQKLLEEVALLHAGGNSTDACSKLETALRAGKLGTVTEQGWSMLFDLLQALNRRQAFETLADAYAKRFEKSAPAWLEAVEEADASLETGGAASVALNGTLSATSESAFKKLVTISQSNPTVRLGLTKVTDADNDGCRLLLDTLRLIKKKKRECLIGGAEEFAALLASKIEMMRRDREETWLLLLELHQQAGKQEIFEDMAVGYAVTFEVSPPSWEALVVPKTAQSASKRPAKDPLQLEGELLIGMGGVAALVTAAKGKDAITIEADRLQRVDEPSAQALLAELSPLAKSGMHIRIKGVSMLIAALFTIVGLDKIATVETRRR